MLPVSLLHGAFAAQVTHTVPGFGRHMSFTEELEVPPGFTMNFKDALHVVSGGVIIRLAVPKGALGLTQRFREVALAFDELQVKYSPTCIEDHGR